MNLKKSHYPPGLFGDAVGRLYIRQPLILYLLVTACHSIWLFRRNGGSIVDSGVMPYSWILCLPRTALDWECGEAFIPASGYDC